MHQIRSGNSPCAHSGWRGGSFSSEEFSQYIKASAKLLSSSVVYLKAVGKNYSFKD